MQQHYWYCLITSLLFWCLPPVAQAYECTTVTQTTALSLPAITIQRDLPVGSPIGNLVTTGSITAFKCSNNAPFLTSQEFGAKAYGTYVMTINGRRIYATDIDGIGYAIYFQALNNCTGAEIWVDGKSTVDGNLDNRTMCLQAGMMPEQPISVKMGIQLYKTAQNTGSGTVAGKAVAAAILWSNKSTWSPEVSVTTNSFSVATLACTVNSSVVSVAMGTVEKRAFSGAGSWPGDNNTKSFNIPLTCNTGTKVNLQVDGDVQNAQQGVLNIKQEKGSASGIGVQLLHNNAPMVLAAAKSLGTMSSDGVYNIPLQARYYQTGSDVEPGSANAVANFTLTYK